MWCSSARKKLACLGKERDWKLSPALAAHLKACPACGEAWRLHLRLLHELAAAPPVPRFGDLVPRVLARLEAPHPAVPYGRWAMAAAFLLAALILGYFLGLQSSTPPVQPETMAATYREALSASPIQPAEFASTASGRFSESVPARSAP